MEGRSAALSPTLPLLPHPLLNLLLIFKYASNPGTLRRRHQVHGQAWAEALGPVKRHAVLVRGGERLETLAHFPEQTRASAVLCLIWHFNHVPEVIAQLQQEFTVITCPDHPKITGNYGARLPEPWSGKRRVGGIQKECVI